MPTPRTRTTPQRVGTTGHVYVNNTTASAQRLGDLGGKGPAGFRSPRPPLPRPPSSGSLSGMGGMGGPSMSSYMGGGAGSGHPSMTPRTKALYAFGESPSKDLHMINQAIGRGSPGGMLSGHKRDHPDGADMSKAPVLNVDLDMEAPSGDDDTKAKMRKLIAQRASRGGGGGSSASRRRPSPDTTVPDMIGSAPSASRASGHGGAAGDQGASGEGGVGAGPDAMDQS